MRAGEEEAEKKITDYINRGGSVYGMPVEEYEKFFHELPEESRNMINERWGGTQQGKGLYAS